MRSLTTSLAFAALALAGAIQANRASAAEKNGTVVTLDGLQSRTPASWKKENVQSELRLMEFTIPRASGDSADSELVLYSLGGGARDNINRWKQQWAPPAGKKLEDVAVVKEIKIAGRPAQLLEIEGTYQTPGFDPKHKGKALAGYRMLAIWFDGPKNAYQIKFYGPAKTIESQKTAFEDWYKGFK